MQRLIIVGAGGFGREVLWLVREVNRRDPAFDVLGFLDDNKAKHGAIIDGIPVLGGTELATEYCRDVNVRFVVGIGEPDVKRQIVERLARSGALFATLVDPGVRGDWERVTIAAGTVICAGAVLTTGISIGAHVGINPGVHLGHDSSIGDFVTVAPNTTVSGAVMVHEGAYLGSGSVVRDHVEVGPWTIVGMGAVVTKSIPGGVVVTGVPAHIVRENSSRRVW